MDGLSVFFRSRLAVRSATAALSAALAFGCGGAPRVADGTGMAAAGGSAPSPATSRGGPEAKVGASSAAARPALRAPTEGWTRIADFAPTELRLKGDVKRTEKASHCARTTSREFVGGQERSQTEDATAFETEARYGKTDAKTGAIVMRLKTSAKRGSLDLREFAMPEAGETIAYSLSPRGEVLRAGSFPKGSVYYVPTLAFPDRAVGKGDTWTGQASWSPVGDASSRIVADMLWILKDAWACGTRRCVELEVSADLRAFRGEARWAGYKNEWRGLLLFDVDAGTAVWSRLESLDRYELDGSRREVDSSLEMRLTAPVELTAAAKTQDPCVALESSRPVKAE